MYDLYCVPLGDELVIGELKREPKAVIVLCDSEAIRYVKERTCHLETNCNTCSKCSECGHHVWHVYNYCPNCGAKVVEE